MILIGAKIQKINYFQAGLGGISSFKTICSKQVLSYFKNSIFIINLEVSFMQALQCFFRNQLNAITRL